MLASDNFSRIASIGQYSFQNCRNIVGDLDLSRVTSLGQYAFSGCNGIVSVRTSALLKSLGSYAFQSCTGLAEADINGTALNLSGAYSPFHGCTSLRRIIFGDGITALPRGSDNYYGPFDGCISLEEVLVGSDVAAIPSGFLSAGTANRQPKPGKVSFSGSITSVGYRALPCSSVTNLEIRLATGCTVDSYAFSGCQAAMIGGENFPQISTIGSHAFQNCGKITGALDLSLIKSIGQYAFSNCRGISSVKFGSTLTSIGYYAFSGCANASSFSFAGAPPSVGSSPFSNVKSGAVGTYTAAHAAEWEAVIDSKGYWNGLKMKPSYYMVIYDANNGTGARTTATVEWGEPTPAGDGTFTWEAHYFMGWAFAPDSGSSLGSDDVIPEPQEGNTVTLYGQWATFEPVAANWGTGSITLKATGVNLKEGEDFFLSFCDAATADSDGAQWEYVDDFGKTVDGNSVSLTDTQFSSRLGGIPAVRYRLQIGKSKEDVRATMCCTTRTRFGLSIGLGSYDSKVYKLYAPKDLSICRNNAELANDVMVQKGGGILPANMVLLTDRTANKATVENISQEWEELAQKAKPGDVIFSFIATHGHASGAVLAYDDLYTIGKFQRDIEPFRTGSQIGVKVVILLLNCHSEAMTSAEHDINFEYGSLCTPNIIYVAVADAKESEVSLHRDDDSSFYAKTYSAGGEFFINQGMNKHRADNLKTLHGVEGVFGNRDGRVDLLECTEYMKALAIGKSDQNPTHVQYDSLKSDIMKDTIIVSSDTFSDVSIPQAPRITDVSEKFFSTTIKVQWEEVSNAQYYKVFYAKAGESTEHWIACNGGLTELEIKTADIATADDREDYTPLDNDTFYEFSMVAVNAGGHSLRSNVYTKKTSIASQGTVYKVSLYANGGSVSPTFKNVENGHIVGSLPTPTRNGRTFLGWFTDAVDGVKIGEHSIVTKDIKCYAHWSKPSTVINLPTEWLRCYPSFAMQASDNPLEASELISANGCRTVGECYALGIDPEDPNDDLKITDFKMEDGKPVITLNHTKDGSGNSFEARIKTLGKANLTDEDWVDVTDKDQSAYRFFKVKVDMP